MHCGEIGQTCEAKGHSTGHGCFGGYEPEYLTLHNLGQGHSRLASSLQAVTKAAERLKNVTPAEEEVAIGALAREGSGLQSPPIVSDSYEVGRALLKVIYHHLLI